jgi:hypothetical protein
MRHEKFKALTVDAVTRARECAGNAGDDVAEESDWDAESPAVSFTGFGPVKGLGFRLCPLQVLGL